MSKADRQRNTFQQIAEATIGRLGWQPDQGHFEQNAEISKINNRIQTNATVEQTQEVWAENDLKVSANLLQVGLDAVSGSQRREFQQTLDKDKTAKDNKYEKTVFQ